MAEPIPEVIDYLYNYFVTEPNPKFWPSYIQSKPILAHGMWSFYQGLLLGLQLADACREQ